MDPGKPDLVTLLKRHHVMPDSRNSAYDLMTGNDRVARRDDAPFHDIQIGSTDGTHGHAHEELVRRRHGRVDVRCFERRGVARRR